jgi:hypothetical protein
MYSSLDTHCVGIGEGNADVSAGNTCFNSSGESMAIPPLDDVLSLRHPAAMHGAHLRI